ncbi:MAG TPA: GPP34 family phosphoprotein [Mycobacterium sp.]|nr:GPP34 family phosphoprotein [Mycobacterium sp.]
MNIADDLLLVLLDNAAARPALDDHRRQRLLAAAVLLDLAYACRIRPAEAGDDAPQGTLVPLMGTDPTTPAAARALSLVARKPVRAETAIAKLRGKVETELFEELERQGRIHSVLLYTKGFRRQEAWTLTDRTRPARVRAAVLAVLTDNFAPDPLIAALISLLHSMNSLGALLSFDALGWELVNDRAAEIASGSWVNESATDLPEINLAVTMAAIRPALSRY